MVSIDKILLDILNNNVTKNTLEFINNCNKEAKDICYHYLFDKFPINRFYIPDNSFTEFLNILTSNCKFRTKTKNYKEIKLNCIPKYNNYKIKDKILFDCNLILVNDKLNYINEFANTIYVTNDYKTKKIFQYTGSIRSSFDCYTYQFILKLINNCDKLNTCYQDIIDDYNKTSKAYQCGLLLNISEKILDIICGEYVFYNYVNILIDCNYKINFDYDTYIIKLIDRIKDFPEIKIMINKKYKNIDEIYLYYNKIFIVHNNFNMFFKLLELHYYKRDFDKYLEFADKNINLLINFKKYTDYEFIFAILFRLFNYMLKNNNIKNQYATLYNVFDIDFYKRLYKLL